jgi:two-component system response regulator YesN
MVKATGIDVAKYIYIHKLPIKVVLISAYNDFALAKQAIEYNVSNYILKPTKLPDIRKIFKKVKEEIDELISEEYKNIELKETSERIDMLLRRQFFSDIYYGAIKSREDIDKRFQLINLPFDPYSNLCCVFSIFTKDNLTENNNIKDIRNFINSTRIAKVNTSSNAMNFYPLHQGSKKITYLAIELSVSNNWNKDRMLKSTYYHFNDLIEQIRAVFNINMHIEMHEIYPSLYDFMEHISGTESEQTLAMHMHFDDMELLDSRITRLVSHIRSDEPDLADNLLNKLFEQIDSNMMLLKSVCNGIILALSNSHANAATVLSPKACETIQKISYAQTNSELSVILEEAIHNIESAPQKGKENAAKDIVGMTKSYIESNYTKDIFLDSAAEHVNISPAYLSRIFKKNTKTSFTQYVMNLRLQKATEYLINFDYNIYNISEMVGYTNIYYFYRIFKNKYGCTPSEYRKEHVNEN